MSRADDIYTTCKCYGKTWMLRVKAFCCCGFPTAKLWLQLGLVVAKFILWPPKYTPYRHYCKVRAAHASNCLQTLNLRTK